MTTLYDSWKTTDVLGEEAAEDDFAKDCWVDTTPLVTILGLVCVNDLLSCAFDGQNITQRLRDAVDESWERHKKDLQNYRDL